MVDRKARKEGTVSNRLEGWLVREIDGGWLKSLPCYVPTGGCGGQCPDQYARMLLTGLRTAEGDTGRIERLKDDGRAFRSWVETAALAGAPRNGVLNPELSLR